MYRVRTNQTDSQPYPHHLMSRRHFCEMRSSECHAAFLKLCVPMRVNFLYILVCIEEGKGLLSSPAQKKKELEKEEWKFAFHRNGDAKEGGGGSRSR